MSQYRQSATQGTWFYDGLGACGKWNTDEDKIVALSIEMYGTGGHCNQVSALSPLILSSHILFQHVKITNAANGKTAYGTVRDKCQACGLNDLGMCTLYFRSKCSFSLMFKICPLVCLRSLVIRPSVCYRYPGTSYEPEE